MLAAPIQAEIATAEGSVAASGIPTQMAKTLIARTAPASGVSHDMSLGKTSEPREAAEANLADARTTLRDSDVAATSVVAEATGELRAAQHRDADADAEFAMAVRVIPSSDYWWCVLPALTQAEYLIDRGRFSAARDLLKALVEAYTQHGYGLRWPRVEAHRERLAAAPASADGSTA